MFSRSEKAAVAPRSSSEDGNYVPDPAAVEYDSDLHVECPPHTTERRLVNRIDFHVIPYLCVLYLLAFLDRVNIANANVFGLSEDLGLASKNSMNTTLAGAFGGLLASAIGKMDGVRSYRGWRWIFILEGLLTVVVSVIFFFVLPNFPEEAKWLTEEERRYVKARLQADQGRSAAERQITLGDIGRVFKDPKIWVGGFMYFGLIVPAYGYAYFSPTIIKTYGYSAIQTQLHSVPPWAAAFGLAMTVAYFSDKTRHRFLFTLIPIAIAIAGFGILISVHDNKELQYAALFLVAMGCYSAMPVIVCWFNMNIGGHHRRSCASAWQVGFGNIGGIIAVFAFLSKDGPEYIPGHAICIAFICLSALSCTLYWVLCSWSNKKRDKTPTDLGLTEYEKTEMGDLSPDYRYLL
ncbi:MFS transporter [Lasiodiplodia theobromae]|uniref:MFS transporter n=1 Tax=Lasiodiplodia theobromae TaxID=45133 RepID=UPI0015C30000|nr:MFS transporter [Lasiodiplodia theobromae]KAF4540272.1 MFS transporter [Lasiodiplodia theobromae]